VHANAHLHITTQAGVINAWSATILDSPTSATGRQFSGWSRPELVDGADRNCQRTAMGQAGDSGRELERRGPAPIARMALRSPTCWSERCSFSSAPVPREGTRTWRTPFYLTSSGDPSRICATALLARGSRRVGTLARLRRRERLSAFVPTPAMALRWHRDLVERRRRCPRAGGPTTRSTAISRSATPAAVTEATVGKKIAVDLELFEHDTACN